MKQNNLKSSKLGWLFCGMLGFMALTLPSCNVGLGNSVDTEKPKVTLDAGLSAGMIIRDSFTLSGTCSDDGYVSKVVITFRNSFGFEKEYVVSGDELVLATESADKVGAGTSKSYTWTKDVNKFNEETGYELPDGNYNIRVVSVDRAETPKESLPTERSIIIDNTAPLMVLDRPSSGDTYGRTFKVKGKVADDSDVKTMKIDVYDVNDTENGTPIHTIWKTNIAPSFNIDAAVYGEEGDDDDYEKIYGYGSETEIEADDKEFLCAITLFDSASKYPATKEEDKLGNQTSVYFLSEGKISDFSDVTMSDLYHIISGTYEPVPSEDFPREDLIEQQESFKKFYAENAQALRTNFFLNPENSPKFAPLGFAKELVNYASFANNEITNGDNLSIQVSVGKDKFEILPDTIAINLYEVKAGAYGSWEKVEPAIELVKALKNEEGETLLDDAEKAERSKVSFSKQQDNSWLVTTAVPKEKGLEYRTPYLIEVKGFDTKGNEIDNRGKDYGFQFVSKAVAPTIKLTGANIFYLNDEGKVTLSGYSRYELGEPDVNIYIYNRTDDETEDLIKSYKPVLTPSTDNRYDFVIEISKDDLVEGRSLPSGQYEIYAEARSPEYSEIEPVKDSRTIIYDVDAPEINDIKITPTVMETTDSGEAVYKLNGKVKVSLNFFDLVGLKAKSSGYKFTGKNSEIAGALVDGDFEIDTELLEDGEEFDLQIYVEDLAGNKTEVSLAADNNKPFVVDQESDKPKVLLDSFEPGILDPSKTNGNTAVSGTKLNGKITDDDGLKKIIITFENKDDPTDVIQPIVIEDALKGTTNETYVLSSVTLPAKAGKYDLKIEVEDINGVTNSPWNSSIKLTDKGPELSNIAIKYDSDKKNTLYTSIGSGEKTFTVTGNVEGEHNALNDKEYLQVRVSDSLANEIATWEKVSHVGPGTWEYEYTIGNNVAEGEYTLYFVAEDANGIYSTEGKVTYKVDNTTPVVSEIKVEPYTNETSTSVDVKITETNEKEFFYKVQEKSVVAPAVAGYADLSSGWNRAPSSSFMLNDLEDSKEYKIYVVAVDKANNVSAVKSEVFIVDTVEPVVSDPVISDSDGIINLSEQAQPFSVSATVTPGTSGIKEVTLWNGDTKIGAMTETSGVYRYSFAANALTDEAYSFVVKAESNAGVTGESSAKEISVDTEAPVISNIEIPHTVEVNGVKYVNGKVNVNLHVHDNKKLASSVAWSFGTGTGKSGTVTISEDQEEDLVFEVDTTKLTDNAANKLTLTLKDVAGNVFTTEYTLNVKQATDKPEISVTYPSTAREKDDMKIAGKNEEIIFTVSDDDGLGSLTVNVKGSKEASATPLTLFDFVAGNTTYSFKVSKAVEDKYDVVISVVDNKQETEGNYSTNETIHVGFSGTNPHDLKFTSSENLVVKSGAALTVAGSYQGGDTTKLYRSVDGAGRTQVTFPDTVTLTAADNTSRTVVLTYVIENIFGESEEKTYTYVIDNKAPVLTGFKVNNNDHNPNVFSNVNEVTINGTWEENDSDSIKVNYWVLSENNSTLCTEGTAKTFSFKKSADGWKYDLKLTNLNQGANYVFFKSYDKVENSSLSEGKKINVDSVSPNLSVSINGKAVQDTGTIYVQNLNDVTIAGVLSDPAPSSGLSTYQAIRVFEGSVPAENYPNYQKTGETVPSYVKGVDAKNVYIFKNEIAHTAAVNADGSFSLKEGDGTTTGSSSVKNSLSKNNGSYKSSYLITVVGEDYKENRAKVSFTLAQDNVQPKNPTINYPSGKRGKDALKGSDFSSGEYSFGGNAEDNDGISSGIKAVYYQVTKGKGLPNPARYSTSAANGWTRLETSGGWAGTMPEQTAGNRGNWTLFVYSEDEAGNVSDIVSEQFDISYAEPVITVKIDGVVNNDTDTIQKTGDFTFVATASDEDQNGTLSVTVTDGGKTGVTSPITTDGLYNLEFSATDEVGNTTTVTRSILKDSTPPSIGISEDLSEWKTKTDFTVEVNVSDNLTNVAAVYWTTDDTAPESSVSDLSNAKWTEFTGSTYKIAGAALAGKSKLKIAAVDGYNNFAVFKSDVKIDTEAPALKLYADSGKTKELADNILISTNKAFDIYITASDTGSGIASVEVNNTSLKETSKGSKIYKYTVPATKGTNAYEVVVTDAAGNINVATLNAFIDTVKPEIKVLTPSLTVTIEGDDKIYINGEIDFEFEVTDDQKLGTTDAVSYTIIDVNDKTVTGKKTLSGTNATVETVNITGVKTTDFADGKCKVVITVKDSCGNENSKIFDDLYINQNTDKPVLVTSNATAEDGKKNLFGLGDMTINGQISDDDGIAKVEYQMQNKGDSPVESKYTEFEIDGTPESTEFSFDIPSEINGEKVLYVRITDTAGEENGTQVISVPFAVDNQVPVLTVVEMNGTGYQSGMFVKENFSIKLNAEDDNTITSVQRTSPADANGKAVKITQKDSNGYYVDEISGATDGNDQSRQYIVTDEYGREGPLTVNYSVDTEEPSVEDIRFAVSDGTNKKTATEAPKAWFTTGNINILAKRDEAASTKKYAVSDKNLRGEVSYELKNTNPVTSAVTTAKGKFNVAVEEENGTKYAELDDKVSLSEGTTNAKYTFVDAAGNESFIGFDINIDTEAPVKEGSSMEYGSVSDQGAYSKTADLGPTSVVGEAAKIRVLISAKDTVSGIKKIHIGSSSGFTPDGTEEVTCKTLTAISASGELERYNNTLADEVVTIDNTKLRDGTVNLYVRFEDAAGNVSDAEFLGSFIYDTKAPEVTITSHADGNTVNGQLTLKGNVVEDNLASDAVPILYVDGKETSATPSLTGVLWTISGIDTTVSAIGDGEHTFVVAFTDKAGNTTEASAKNRVTLKVDQDSDKPVIKLDELYTAKDKDNNLIVRTIDSTTFTGSVTDDDGTIETGKFLVSVTPESEDTAGEYSSDKIVFNGSTFTVDITKFITRNADTGYDNEYKVWFKVTDRMGGVFETGKTLQPKVLGKSTDKVTSVETEGPVTFNIDQGAPSIEELKISYSKDVSGNAVWTDFKNNLWYGGKVSGTAQLRIKASDTITTDPEKLKVQVVTDPVISYGEGETAPEVEYKGGYHYYTLDFAKVPDGLFLVTINVSDASDHPTSKRINVTVDNTAPVGIAHVNPSEDNEQTSDFTLKGDVSDGSGVGIVKMEYCVPVRVKDAAAPVLPSDEAGDNGITWISENDRNADSVLTREENSTVWSIEFKDLHDNVNLAAINSSYAGYVTDKSDVYNIPVWFRITDKQGNVKYDSHTIKYNPDFDKPKISITSPKHDKNVGDVASGKPYKVLGGTLHITGTASDNDGISAVYLQFDIDGDGKYDDTDKAKVKAIVGDSNFVENPVDGVKWGVLASGTRGWNAEFDSSELDDNGSGLQIGNAANTGNKTLNIRAVAVDTDPSDAVQPSNWSDEIHVSVNNNVPLLEDFKLVQYSDSVYANKIHDEAYVSGMYINKKGYWRLEGVAYATSGISRLVFNDGTEKAYSSTETSGSDYVKAITDSSATGYGKGYNVVIPVNDSMSITITAYDAASLDTPQSFTINVDGDKPEFKGGSNESDLVVYRDTYGESGNKLSNDVEIRNYNGNTATIASKAKDAGSGFDKAVFFVSRKGEKNVYNFMESYGSGRNANKTTYTDGIYNLTTGTLNSGKTEPSSGLFLNQDGLPVIKYTGATRGTRRAVTVNATDIHLNKNIRSGGLVYIGGAYHVIDTVTPGANTVTVTLKEDVDTAYKTVYFVYAMAVDNEGESLNTANSNIIDNDDGDNMLEKIAVNGTETTWQAAITSANIPDGPVDLHVVVFDKAGNARQGTISTRVSNNKPKIARVTLGTDLDGNGPIGNIPSETKIFYATTKAASSDDEKDSYEAGLGVWNLNEESDPSIKNWKIKKDFSVTPEFVGGTDNIYYIFETAAGKSNLDAAKTTPEDSGLTDNKLSNATRSTGKFGKLTRDATSGKIEGTITLANTLLTAADTTGTNVNTYSFSFWDETEGTVPGVDSGSCVLNINIKQRINDNTRPETYIHPFFWKANGGKSNNSSVSSDNSVQWTKNSANKEVALGHIELTEDLEGTAAATTYGTDPKVSGKIVLRGTVYDDTRINNIKIVSSESSIIGSSSVTAARSNSWANSNGLTVTDHGIQMDGHLIEWSLLVDTEQLSSMVAEDITFTVIASDGDGTDGTYSTGETIGENLANQTSWETVYATATQAEEGKYYETAEEAVSEQNPVDLTNHKPVKFNLADSGKKVYEYKYGTHGVYQMDVVPYVTSVSTSLSSMDGAVPGKYSRSARGHYAVQSVASNFASGKNPMNHKTSEDVTIEGFNLNHGTVKVNGEDPKSKVAANASTGKLSSITFNTASLASGNLTVLVNGIQAMNNLNKNEASGSVTGATYTDKYNYQGNGINNNILTDDLVFDVWEFNDRVAVPAKSSLGGTVMKVNSGNGLIQYAYADGVYLVMGNGYPRTNTSAQKWMFGYDTYQEPSIGFHIDQLGRTFASGHSSDTNSGERVDVAKLTASHWGSGPDTGGYDRVTNNICIETLAQNSVMERQRLWSPTFATTSANVNSTSSVNLYMAYYDMLNKEIRFRAGFVPNTLGSFGQFERGAMVNGTYDEQYNLHGAQVIACAPGSTNSTVNNDGTRGSSEFVSVAARTVGTKDLIFVVWYDSYSSTCRYAYQIRPNNAAGTAVAWTNFGTLFSGGGKYCQAAFDKEGGLHVAAFAGKDHVYYAYSKAFTGADASNGPSFVECRVDATDSVGQNLTLDVAYDGGHPIPYIGYKSTTGYPKYAHYSTEAAVQLDAATSTEQIQGVDSKGAYTGNWEVTIVPTPNAIYLNPEDKVNVGVWKDAGVLRDSKIPTGTNAGKVGNSTGANDGTSTTYGNGTSNGVLVYQIVDSTGTYVDCLESAQIR